MENGVNKLNNAEKQTGAPSGRSSVSGEKKPANLPPKLLPKLPPKLPPNLPPMQQPPRPAGNVTPLRKVPPRPNGVQGIWPPSNLPKRIEDLKKTAPTSAPAVAAEPKVKSEEEHIDLTVKSKKSMHDDRSSRFRNVRTSYTSMPGVEVDDEMLMLTAREKELIRRAERISAKITRMIKRIKSPLAKSNRRLHSPRYRRSAKIPPMLWGEPMEELRVARSKLLLTGKVVPARKKRRSLLLLFFIIFSIIALLGATTFAIITIVNQDTPVQEGYIEINERDFEKLDITNYNPGTVVDINMKCINRSSGPIVLRFYMYVSLYLPEGVTATQEQLEAIKELKVEVLLDDPEGVLWTAGTVEHNGVVEICYYYNGRLPASNVISMITGFKVMSRTNSPFMHAWENQTVSITIAAQGVEPSYAAVQSAWGVDGVPVEWLVATGLAS